MSKIYNSDIVLLASAARTVTTSSSEVDSSDTAFRGVRAIIDVTSISTSGSVVLTLQGYDANFGYFTVLSTAALTAAGTVVVKVHPDLTAASNSVAQDFLTDKWRATVTHTGFDGVNPASVTYAVSAHMLD